MRLHAVMKLQWYFNTSEMVINHVQSNLSYLDSCYPGTGQLILSILC